MPEYMFHCRRCDRSFSAFMHIEEHEKSVAECPQCHQSDQVEREMAVVNVMTSKKS